MKNLEEGRVDYFEMNKKDYFCIKKGDGDETIYMFFSTELYKTQIAKKEILYIFPRESPDKFDTCNSLS